jgi:hypothetical protein
MHAFTEHFGPASVERSTVGAAGLRFASALNQLALSVEDSILALKCGQCVGTRALHGAELTPQKHALNCANPCAGGGTRTLTLFRARAPKARVSANSTTPAFAPRSYRFSWRTPCRRSNLMWAHQSEGSVQHAVRGGVPNCAATLRSRPERLRDSTADRHSPLHSAGLALASSNAGTASWCVELRHSP